MQSEYVSDRDKRREFVSGFTGSAGFFIIINFHLIIISKDYIDFGNIFQVWHLLQMMKQGYGRTADISCKRCSNLVINGN